MTPLEIIAALAPDLVLPTTIDTLITLATQRTSLTAFGTNRNTAIAYRTLWMIVDGESMASGGSGGRILSESEGKLSRSYQRSNSKNEDLGSNQWGVLLQGLIKSNISGIPARGCGCRGGFF